MTDLLSIIITRYVIWQMTVLTPRIDLISNSVNFSYTDPDSVQICFRQFFQLGGQLCAEGQPAEAAPPLWRDKQNLCLGKNVHFPYLLTNRWRFPDILNYSTFWWIPWNRYHQECLAFQWIWAHGILSWLKQAELRPISTTITTKVKATPESIVQSDYVQCDHIIPGYTGQIRDEHSQVIVFQLVDNRLVRQKRQYSTTAFISSTYKHKRVVIITDRTFLV